MLTVKLVEPTGHEQVYEATRVWTQGPPIQGAVTFVDGETGLPVTFGCFGTVFVMNREGRTIAQYVLPGTDKWQAAPEAQKAA